MGVSSLTRKRLKNVKKSAVSDHLLHCSCSINFDDFSNLATDFNKFKLLLVKLLLTSLFNNTWKTYFKSDNKIVSIRTL